MPNPTTLERLRALLHSCLNLSAVAREADVSVRTLYRIRDGETDTTTQTADRIMAAARKYQPKPERAAG